MALEDYYVARMSSIYRSKPKASATVALFAKQMLADGLALEIPTTLEIDTAVGAQLDLIGKYVGAPRDVGVADNRPYFGFVTYDYPAGVQNPEGFVIYTSLAINATGVWFEYEFTGKSSSQLPDFSYRQLLKLKILTNFNFNTMSDVQAQITGFFPNQLQLRDNQDMTLTYFYGGTFQLPLSVLESALPRPMGVKVNAVPAIAFDVLVSSLPAFNSQTPSPLIAFGEVSGSATLQISIVNVTSAPFTILAFNSTNPDFTTSGYVPPLAVTLNLGESLTFDLVFTASLEGPVSGALQMFLTSLAGVSRFDIDLTAAGTPVTSTSLLQFTDFYTDLANGQPVLVGPAPGIFSLYTIVEDSLNPSAEIEILNVSIPSGGSLIDPAVLPKIVTTSDYEDFTVLPVGTEGNISIAHTGANSPFVVKARFTGFTGTVVVVGYPLGGYLPAVKDVPSEVFTLLASDYFDPFGPPPTCRVFSITTSPGIVLLAPTAIPFSMTPSTSLQFLSTIEGIGWIRIETDCQIPAGAGYFSGVFLFEVETTL